MGLPIYDAMVVGGGLVGSAVAYGLRSRLDRIAVLDEGDIAFRASRGNFGLVWLQGKGLGMARYVQWTRMSQQVWATLADELLDLTDIDVHLEQKGGMHVLLSDAEVEARIKHMDSLMTQPGMVGYPWKLLDRQDVANMVPGIGPDVCGAAWTHMDGCANPLRLLRAFHTAFARLGIEYLPRQTVGAIRKVNDVFEVQTPKGLIRAQKLILAAGLGNSVLGRQIGLDVPVRPQRGQVIVLERTRRMLDLPCNSLRQMQEGSWLIGDSQEEAGYVDTHIDLPIVGTLADRAVRTLPALRDVRAIRIWSALRVMTRDGFPIYQQSETCPGAFVATCHSGVTLAAAHAKALAPMIAAGRLDDDMAPFSTRRFHVQ